MAESKEELKRLLMRLKEKIERASLKLNIKKNQDGNPQLGSQYYEIGRKEISTTSDMRMIPL